MKKLMIAAAIVCAAAFVQAATVGWSFGQVNGYGADGKGWSSEGLTGDVSIQLIIGSTLSEGVIGGLVYNDSADVALEGGWAYPEAVEVTAMQKDVAYYTQVILTSGDSTLTSGIFQMMATTAEEGFVYPNFGMGTNSYGIDDATTGSLTGLSTFGEVGGAFAEGGWLAASVPEPTSGLLLLLGVAGLALRRRRA